MSGATLDLLGAQPTSVAARQQQQQRRRSSYDGRSAAGIHGGGSRPGYIGSVSAGIYKSFRERFMNGNGSAGSGGSSDCSNVDYRVLRQRDAELGKLSSSGSSSEQELEEEEEQEGALSSSSSVEDIFASEAERRKWRRKVQPEQQQQQQRRSTTKGKRRRKRKVSATLSYAPSPGFPFAIRYSAHSHRLLPLRA